jgi:hypothetical protein
MSVRIFNHHRPYACICISRSWDTEDSIIVRVTLALQKGDMLLGVSVYWRREILFRCARMARLYQISESDLGLMMR